MDSPANSPFSAMGSSLMNRSAFRRPSAKSAGFTLIEISIVLVIVGIVISIVATVLPSLIHSSKIKKTQAVLEKVENALSGYVAANGRLPFADSDNDGYGDAGACFGLLPHRDLGLSSREDAWTNALKYGVYETLTASTKANLCTVLAAAATSPFDPARANITQGASQVNMAYILASGGPKDLDGTNGFFDGHNGDDNAAYDDPERLVSNTYDDLMAAKSFNELSGAQGCGGGGGGGSGGGVGSSEVCDNSVDDDGDGYVDCFDQDCYGVGACGAGPPPDAVRINENPLAAAKVGASYTASVQATGGTLPYTWALVSSDIPGLSIGALSGSLYGTIDVCAGNYSVTVRVVDTASHEDTHTFSITVENPIHVISPEPSGGIDFTCNSGACVFDFEVSGAKLGERFEWAITWQGPDPGGFQLLRAGERTAQLKKVSTVTGGPGTYAFQIRAWDSACATNEEVSSCCYRLDVTAAGLAGPLTANLAAHWALDECSWNGTAGEVRDQEEGLLDGTAKNGAQAIGTGKVCRAGRFDGVNDYLDMGDILNSVFGSGSSAFTLAAWIYPFSLGSPQTDHATQNCFAAKASDAFNDNLEVGVSATGRVHVYLDTQGQDQYADFGPAGAVPLNAWSFIAVTYQSGTLTVTINEDRYENTTTWSGGGNIDSAQGSAFTIGSSQHQDNYFHGKIDEVMVFSRVLTTEEIGDLYALRHACTGSCYATALAEYRMENFPWTGTDGEVTDSGSGVSHGRAAAQGTGALPMQSSASGGKVCRAGIFSRVNADNGGYLDLGDPSDGDHDPGADAWTVSAWIRWDGSTGENIIYNKESLYEARVQDGYVNYAWMPHWSWDGGTTYPLPQNTWTHLTTVYDGTRQYLYKDGLQVFARDQTGAIGSNGSKLLVGARGSAGPRNFFGGMIDEFRIYDRALSEAEIQNDMGATRNCAADTVVITTTALPGGTLMGAYAATLTASGGTPPYGWEIVPPNPVSGLSIVPNTGVLQGTLNVCAGTHDILIRVSDAGGRMDERPLPLAVANGTLAISPSAPQTLNCTLSTFFQDFTVSGPRIGPIGTWTIGWLGTNPGGFEAIATGENTVRFRKIGTSVAGIGYQFKLTGRDASCADNRIDSGYYVLNVSGDGASVPYYAGIVGEWRLDECAWSGTLGEVLDLSGNALGGTAVNGAAPTALGRVCRAGAFDGANDYVTVPDSGALRFGAGRHLTLSLWVKVEGNASDWVRLAGKGNSTYRNYGLWLATSGEILFQIYSDGGAGNAQTAVRVNDGLWHHVVGVYDTATMKVYVDTVERATLNYAQTPRTSADPFTLGYAGFHTYLNGKIDEVLLFDRALSASEVQALYGLTRACSGACYSAPVAEYRMDESAWTIGQAGDVQDTSGNGYHGTPYGSAAVNTADSRLCYAGDFQNNDSAVAIGGLPVSTAPGDQTTVCFWMKWAGNGSEMPIGWGGNYDLYFASPTRLGFNTAAGDVFGIDGVNVLVGTWHHVGAVFHNHSPLKNQLYIDGVLQPITVLQGTPVNRTVGPSLTISGWDMSADYKYDGLIDEVRIYPRGLSTSEIIADMNTIHTCPGGP